MKRTPSSGRVAVLLVTRNGAACLDDHLASIAAQTYPDIDLWISDDASTDATVAIINDWSKRWSKGRVRILEGCGDGPAENFRSLIVNPDIEADYFAFADQHDLWEVEKVANSVRWIEHNAFAVPSAFCSQSLAIRQDGAVSGVSRPMVRDLVFGNALVQDIAPGNRMLFNRMARDLLAQSCRKSEFSSHGWWLYLIVSGAGGVVHCDPQILARERQAQGGNIWNVWLARVRGLIAGEFVEQSDLNVQGLVRNRALLTDEARATCDLYWKVRSDNFIKRLYYLRKSGVYRQTMWEQAGLYLAALLRRL
ncbi:glycosyltransferase [Phyllobacterium brassicacearum]|uniref:glycosyltransferase n=1 Tax=Phyllobacterium brassicacearum TaxID=314235 RepID=UPI0010DBD812|nr:glycosyltransferase [Phyllobacterium brassicacearum]TDQ35902.1 glycosyl transferase family 2 [Phyllobacterium brassicacearum]